MDTTKSRMSIAALSLFALATAPVLAGERPYDPEMRRIIDTVYKQLDDFTDEMGSKARSGKVTNAAGVATDISEFVADFKAEGKRLRERFNSDDAATTNAFEFLKKAKAADGFVGRHPGFSEAESEWARFQPTLRTLAAAYLIDWDADPASWKALRMTDREIKELLGDLQSQIKAAGKGLDSVAKSAGVDRAARQELATAVDSLRAIAKGLRGAFGKQEPVGPRVESVLAGAKAIQETAGTLGIAEAAKGAWAPLEKSLATLAGAFGKS